MKYFFSIILVVVSLTAVSQKAPSKSAKAREKNKAEMEAQIKKLKNGVLLVRLFTRQNAITALRQKGYEQSAKDLEREQYLYNSLLIKAFRTQYTFSPVYFFYSHYSDPVREKKLSSVVFLNDSLQPDSSIRPPSDQFLIAEFGNVEQDTAGMYRSQTDTSHSITPKQKYPAGTDFGFRALIVRSDAFVQLKKPFPYYVKMSRLLPFFSKQPPEIVRDLNVQLKDYYKEVTGERENENEKKEKK